MERRINARRIALACCSILLLLGASTGRVWSSTPDQAHRALPTPAAGSATAVAAAADGPDLERLAAFRFRSDPIPPKPRPALLAVITRSLPIRARPGSGRVIGVMPAFSKYIHTQTVAWIGARSANGRFGKVTVPYGGTAAAGWISLAGLKLRQTPIVVHAYLARHLITVTRLGRVILRFRAATGSPSSPTPPGSYFVTDRVPENPSGPLGAFAFGISGIQTHLPAGWGGGNQLAIHGTNNPGTIGMSVSAGCLRVSALVLEQLKPLLLLGTPVVIER